MSVQDAIGFVLVLALGIYLLVALIRAEEF